MLVVDTHDLASLLDVVGAAKEHINLLQRNLLRLGDEEVHEHAQDHVHSHEEEEALEALVGEEGGEELLENGVGDVLHLRAHADGLGADVDGEDLGGVHPRGRAPGRLVEEGEEEQQEDDGDADGLALGAVGGGGRLEADDGDDEHADGHAGGADDEEPAAAEAVGGPHGVEGEEDAAGGVEGVDEVDGVVRGPDLLVDGGGVAVEGALAGELLADVEDEGEVEALADGGVLEEGGVAPADGLLLVLDGLADGEELLLDLLLGVADAHEGGAGGVDVALLLDVPAGALGLEGQGDDDDDGDEHLEDDDHLPVPLAERGAVLGAGVVLCDVLAN